ncbi:MAG: PocR ligand-binding domain-containing protein [Nitrospirae bacterium]|nr:PocR ligand-binding domain-containing protein [Nitrospirota bacterium]
MAVNNIHKPWPYVPEYLTEFLSRDILSIIQTGIAHKERIPLSICEFRNNEPREFGPVGQVRSEFCNRYRELQIKGNEKPGDVLCNQCRLYGTARDIIVNNRLDVGDYWCHMGIVELVAPIVVNGTVVAVLFGGQIIYEHMKEEIISNLTSIANGQFPGASADSCIKGSPDLLKMKLVPRSKIDSLVRLLRETSGNRKEDLEKRKAILREYAEIISAQASNIHRELKRSREAEVFHRVALLFENDDCASIDQFKVMLSRVFETVNSFCGLKKSVLFTNYRSDNKDVLTVFHASDQDAAIAPEHIHLNMESARDAGLTDFTCLAPGGVGSYLSRSGQLLYKGSAGRTGRPDFETIIRKGNEKGISIALGLGPGTDAVSAKGLIEGEPGFFQNLLFFLYSAINNKLTSIELLHKERLLQKKFVKIEQKVSDIAHEFKMRLQTIRTEADIWDLFCAKAVCQCVRSEASRAYSNISSSIGDLSNYTNRALSEHSPGLSPESSFREAAGLSSLIVECVSRYNALAKKKSLTFLIDETVLRLPEFPIDRDEFACAMNNLIDNAFKYSLPGREVHISAGFHENTISISISNTGICVYEDEKLMVFERNYRGRAARAALKSKGQGIGLSETREIIWSHGGDITLESRRGEIDSDSHETTITVTLPYEQKERGSNE